MSENNNKRGFLTFAQETKDRDYLRMAYGLALSLKLTQSGPSGLTVAVTPGTKIPDKYAQVFDHVIDIPWLDEARNAEWKLQNEWKAFHFTPYDHTVKLDADMLFTQDISTWWPVMERQDVLLCDKALNYRGQPIPSLDKNPYRACFAVNHLPDVYTAFMFFKKSEKAKNLFEAAEIIFHNWQRFFEEFLEPNTRPDEVSTDVVFALAMRTAGITIDSIAPEFPIPRFIHMKTRLQDWPDLSSEDWAKHVQFSVSKDHVRIANIRQVWPLHYHDKSFLTDTIIQSYEKALGL